jgi:hypothetical protein
MLNILVSSLLLVVTSSSVTSQVDRTINGSTHDELLKHIYPLAPEQKSPKITVDAHIAPDLQIWGETARDLATEWFPHLCRLLSTQDWKAPKSLTFVFRKGQDAPAYTAGGEISFSVDYVRAHPGDLGMVIHELTHVVQSYPGSSFDTGWLVEGIADYTRWWRYEPEAPRSRINFAKATYHDAYRTTAWFLAWVSQKYDSRMVPALDLNLRIAEDPLPTFVKYTGKTADALWDEFKVALGPRMQLSHP